ncbi:MAG: bifunctional hydroxymethylpyrimidine kinase/phosphomethylpyrimidine kinase [Hyphomicrobiaceae bacterium]
MTVPFQNRAIALTIAGSDSSGGAGIQADLKTFCAFGVYGASVLTALTAQNTRGVQDVHAVPAAFVEAQIESVLSDLDVGALKTGMLATADIVGVVARRLAASAAIPTVVDPVMVATSGDVLLQPDAVAAVRDELLRTATVVTPNLGEAAQLLSIPLASSNEDMVAQAKDLLSFGSRAVLLKGGHSGSDRAADVLVQAGGTVEWFDAPRIDTENTHGTGCTLAAAIAAGLARGQDIAQAVKAAKDFLTRAIQAGVALGIGHGRGPVDHLWSDRTAG